MQAVRTALRSLNEGKSLQDATSVCDPDILKQIFKWRVLCCFHLFFLGVCHSEALYDQSLFAIVIY